MIKNKTPNALNFFDIRRVDFPVEHFESITMPVMYNIEDSVAKWIELNLKRKILHNKGTKYSRQYCKAMYSNRI